MSAPLNLIVGVGNPGAQYAETRHNVGVWFVEKLAETLGGQFREEKKFFGRVANVVHGDRELRLLIPSTYMNESGKAVGALVHFYRVPHQRILIAHDELDLPVGAIKLKQQGGMAGHNGLRDISRCLGGSQDFNRLRIGVGHPGDRTEVTGHVLSRMSTQDREQVWGCIDAALDVLPMMAAGEWQQAMHQLHSQ